MVIRNQKREQKTRELILDLLTKNEDGLTISDISRILALHYTTVSKYLAVLEAFGAVAHRDIGMAKVFKINKSKGTKK
jgi:predicted ArsR family transcriptional regulator